MIAHQRKEGNDVLSLNDCLVTGPPLITGDVQKAFLQIRIDDRDRDVQRIL